MACEYVKFGDTVAICCSRGTKPKWCAFCHERPATKLCDYKLENGKTCDAPICDHCTTNGGKDIDYCPRHKAEAKQGVLFL
jgi:protein-arginine kinase activator protein McsA